jgi:CO/xanthine dehydrogenase FAD-binding subunit
MISLDFDYFAPQSLDEALALLDARNNVAILSGGYSLISELKSKKTFPSIIIDTKLIPGLNSIAQDSDGSLEIGSSTSLVGLSSNQNLVSNNPSLTAAIDLITDRQLLCQTTIGDSYFYDGFGIGILAVLYAYGAKFLYKSKSQTITQSYLLPPPAEMLLTNIILPKSKGNVKFNQIVSSVNLMPAFGVVSNLEIRNGIINEAQILIYGQNIPIQNIKHLENLLLGASVEDALQFSYLESYISDLVSHSSCSPSYLANLLKHYIVQFLTN